MFLFHRKDSTWEPESNISPDVIEEFKQEERSRKSLLNTTSSITSSISSTTIIDTTSNTTSTSTSKSNEKTIKEEKPTKDEFKVKDYLEHVDECAHLMPEKIIGATEIDKNLVFLLKFENSKQIYLIQSKIANMRYPQTVIQFYEEHYTFID